MSFIHGTGINPGHSNPDVTRKELKTALGTVYVEGPLSPERLKQYTMCSGLSKFRRPPEQHLALIDIAGLPEGMIFAARIGDTIVGYITFHYPEFERWAQSGMLCMLELGAIEVSKHFRGLGISRELVGIPFAHGRLNDKIIVSLECYWSWDLQDTNLKVFEYRNMMEKLLARPGFVTMNTDDPDIISHPANMLSVRIGNRVSEEDIFSFEGLRYRGKWLL